MATRTQGLNDAQREFLEQPFYGAVTTLRGDGSPHSTVVWVDVDDEAVIFNTVVGRAKERHLRRDPRASVIVIDPENAYRWLSVSGPAELTVEGADEEIDRLAKKYIGRDQYPWRKPEEQRINVRIRPEHVDSYGFE